MSHRADKLALRVASVLQGAGFVVYYVGGHVRDRLSTDMWRILGGLEVPPGPPGGPPPRKALSEVLDLLDRKIITLAAFGGLVAEGMTRGQGWRFLDMGRKLERVLQITGMLRSTLTVSTATSGSS